VLRSFTLEGASATEPAADDALVLAAQRDPAAFGALYERYLPNVYRYLAARSATPEAAADLTQAVFLKAFDNVSKFRPGPTPFTSWLFRIARNAAIDGQRRERRRLPWLTHEQPAGSSETPESLALRGERIAEVRQLVAQLAPDKRDLIALRYAGGLTIAEIAPLVGKSPEAVKKQLQRTLRQLKENYRD
jgi:RNA polymerase sigma-70 factor (ECF subfamily)